MRERSVILITEDESGAYSAAARVAPAPGGFTIRTEGGSYTVTREGGSLRILGEGELLYVLELDPERETAAEIVTPYGTLSARVSTHGFSFAESGRFEADYTLHFAGEASRRKIGIRSAHDRADDKEGT